jgi:hypothetical protein
MNLTGLSLCGRAQALLPRLVTGRASDAALARHLGTCPRCRAGLRRERLRGDAPAASNGAGQQTAYVLAVVRAAGLSRLAALLAELARSCAAEDPRLAARLPAARRPRQVAAIVGDVLCLRGRLDAAIALEDLSAWSVNPPAPAAALQAARLCLAAAEHLDGPCEARRLQLAACSLAASDEATAGTLCSELAAAAGRPVERARLARRAAQVERDWGLPPERLRSLLRQPARAACN